MLLKNFIIILVAIYALYKILMFFRSIRPMPYIESREETEIKKYLSKLRSHYKKSDLSLSVEYDYYLSERIASNHAASVRDGSESDRQYIINKDNENELRLVNILSTIKELSQSMEFESDLRPHIESFLYDEVLDGGAGWLDEVVNDTHFDFVDRGGVCVPKDFKEYMKRKLHLSKYCANLNNIKEFL